MSNKAASALSALVAAAILTGCHGRDAPAHTPTADSTGGVVITSRGKVGIDTGGGFVIPLDGSPPHFDPLAGGRH